MAHNPKPTVADPALTQNHTRDERHRETVRVTLIGSILDLSLGIAKLIVGFIANSQALIADGIHSLSDLATDVLVIYASKHASREADAEHPYGHERIETAATVGLSIALIGVAVGISIDAVRRLFHPEQLLQPGFWALAVAVISILSKEAIYHYTLRAARKYRSDILRANAWHSRTDAISSIIVVIGVAGAMAGLNYLDAIAAVAVAVLIAKIGWNLGWNSITELVDTALDQDRVEAIRRSVLEASGVDAIHMLRTRRMAGNAVVDFHIQVDPRLSVSEAHHVGECVRNKLIAEIPEVSDVTVHVDTENDQAAAASIMLPPRREILARLQRYFADIEEAKTIEKVMLHYLKGKLYIDLLLPLRVLSSTDDGTALQQRFAQALQQDQDIAGVDCHFH